MCGRYSLGDPDPMQRRFGLPEFSEARLTPRFNVAPSELIPIIVERPEGRELRMVKWGFNPPFMKPGKRPPPINARAESMQKNGMFRKSIERWRCLIPADGFYEWKSVPGEKRKQPVFIRLKDGELFGFAGLYTSAKGEEPGTALIITTEPNELVAPIHDRMPVILRPQYEDAWLDPEFTDADEAATFLQPYPSEQMESWTVSTKVNTAGTDDPTMIEPIDESAKPEQPSLFSESSEATES